MDRIRQFVNQDLASVVMCEWDSRHGHWVCDSDRDGRFHCCVPKMGAMYQELLDEGYQEQR